MGRVNKGIRVRERGMKKRRERERAEDGTE